MEYDDGPLDELEIMNVELQTELTKAIELLKICRKDCLFARDSDLPNDIDKFLKESGEL